MQQHRMVRVVAPATLEAGYTFEASVDDYTFLVVVPKGGVKEGQEFEVPLSDEHSLDLIRDPSNDHNNDHNDYNDDNNHNDYYGEGQQMDSLGAPIGGRWRTGLCSCCDVVTQATCWMGFCCPPILLAQLLTRLRLTWRAQESTPDETSLTFNRIVLTFIVVLWFGLIPFVSYGVALLFYLLVLYVSIRLRRYMRTKYAIAPSIQCCTSSSSSSSQQQQQQQQQDDSHVDDCVCIFFCPPCSIIQMARHTHNDKEYPGYCCTTHGLEQDAPEIPA